MREGATAPSCIVEGCEQLSALSAVAEGKFLRFTTSYCARHYEMLLRGETPPIDRSRILVERIEQPPPDC